MLPGQWRDGVGGSLPAGEWQGLTRGSIYKIDVVLSASASYCGNHIPISTKNKTHHLPLPLLAPGTGLSLQTILIFQHQISIFPQYLQESVMVFPPWHTGLSVFAPVAVITNSQDS